MNALTLAFDTDRGRSGCRPRGNCVTEAMLSSRHVRPTRNECVVTGTTRPPWAPPDRFLSKSVLAMSVQKVDGTVQLVLGFELSCHRGGRQLCFADAVVLFK